MSSWIGAIEHNRWLSRQMYELLKFGHGSRVEVGFGYQGKDGTVDPKRPVELYITARMTHIYSLATLMGIPGSRTLADHGLTCLRKYFKDHEHGGWYSAIEPKLDADGNAVPVGDGKKEAYGQAFVLLAASSAASASRPHALDLMHEAMHEQEKYWWDTRNNMVYDEYDRAFTDPGDYRGMNANMHTVEAYLAAADVNDDPVWLDRALMILERAHDNAKAHDWRLPEHYDSDWQAVLDYNRDNPEDQFRPYGSTVGHGMEWTRLVLHARAALKYLGREVPEWMMDMASEMFERARVDGWRRNGHRGFYYTVDFEGKPVTEKRFWWVTCEAIGATVAMRRALLDDGAHPGHIEHYDHCYRSWIDYISECHIIEPGRWQMELTPDNKPADTVWPGHPDIYHAVQALLLPRLPLTPCFASALSAGYLDKPELPVSHRRKGGLKWWKGD